MYRALATYSHPDVTSDLAPLVGILSFCVTATPWLGDNQAPQGSTKSLWLKILPAND